MIGVVLFVIFIILLTYLLYNLSQVDIAIKMLEVITEIYLSGGMSEESYEESRTKIYDNFSRFQMLIFNTRFRR